MTDNTATNQDTKTQILDAAEMLFSEFGYNATSMRTITTAAGVNIAAVNYHFGSKKALIIAVYERRLEPLAEQRNTWLNRLESEAGENGVEVEDIIEAFVAPALNLSAKHSSCGTMFMRLLGRAYLNTDPELQDYLSETHKDTFKHFLNVLSRSLPHVPFEELALRMDFVTGSMAYALIARGTEKLSSHKLRDSADVEAITQSLVPFLADAMRAPCPSGAVSENDASKNTNNT